MKEIDLQLLNASSPYHIFCDAVDSFSFMTDYGVSYKIHFMQDYSIWDSGAYQFIIANENKRKSPSDIKLKETVFAIIEAFFRSNHDILLYVCETGDGKESLRNRLFLRWLKEYDKKDAYYLAHIEIEDEGINNFATLIVEKSNPRLHTIIGEFKEAVNEIIKPSSDNQLEEL